MKLYTFPYSSNARKAEMACILLGIDVEREIVNLGAGQQRAPGYLALNANGRVPTLVDGDFTLWESNAIMAYLADQKPGNTLYPSAPKARADVNRWLFWQASHWSGPIGGLNQENMIKRLFGGGEPDPVQVERHETLLKQSAAVLDGHLANRTWVAGPEMTIADVSIASSMMYLDMAKLPLRSFQNVMAWFERVRETDAWKKTEPPPFPGR